MARPNSVLTVSLVDGWRGAELGHNAQADSLGELAHSKPLHHARPVNLDRAYADTEMVSDQLVRVAGHQSVKNLPLARTEGCDPPDGVGDIAVAIGADFVPERRLDRPEQSMIAVWLLQEICCARLHRANSRLNISLGGHDNDRQVVSHLAKFRLDVHPADARQRDIPQN